MTVIALSAVRSCGVSTLGLALAATWPTSHRMLLIEADPAGGTVAAMAGSPPDHGLVTLAAAARHDNDPNLVWDHCLDLPGQRPVLAGPAASSQAQGALGMLTDLFARLGELDADVMVDCGRMAISPPVTIAADRTVMVARPRLADLNAFAAWQESHATPSLLPALVLMGDGPYADTEVAEALDVSVLAHLPWEPRTAAALASCSAADRRLRTSPLLRSARSLAEHLALTPTTPITGQETPRDAAGEVHTGDESTSRLRILRPLRREHPTHVLNGTLPEEVHQ